MELILSTLIGCFAIGVILSAPMGPIGILCVQRTLNKGREAGWWTGVGASISDLFYCLLTGLGMSFVTNFIETNQNVLQIVGSIILLIFGIYLIKRNPATNIQEPTEKKKRNPLSRDGDGFFLHPFQSSHHFFGDTAICTIWISFKRPHMANHLAGLPLHCVGRFVVVDLDYLSCECSALSFQH